MASGTRIRRRVSGTIVAIALAVVASGCDWFKNDNSPSETTTTTTETFAGTLPAQGSNVYTFTVAKSGTVKVTLTTVGPTATTPVGLGIGTPNGSACTMTSSTPSAVAGSTAQITVTQNPGSYCIRVFDSGSVATALTFSVTVEHT